MAAPKFLSGNANARLSNSDRTVHFTAAAAELAAGVAAYGRCRSNWDLSGSGKVSIVVRDIQLSDADGSTPDLTRGAAWGFRAAASAVAWADVSSGSFLGGVAGEWGSKANSASGFQSIAAGTTVDTTTDIDGAHGQYYEVSIDLSTGEVWFGRITPGEPATIEYGELVGSGGPGDPEGGTDPWFTVSGSGIEFGAASPSDTRISGLTILTEAEAAAIGWAPPDGYSYASDGASGITVDLQVSPPGARQAPTAYRTSLWGSTIVVGNIEDCAFRTVYELNTGSGYETLRVSNCPNSQCAVYAAGTLRITATVTDLGGNTATAQTTRTVTAEPAADATMYVDPVDGSDLAAGTSSGAPKATVQAALDAFASPSSSAHRVVYVKEGTEPAGFTAQGFVGSLVLRRWGSTSGVANPRTNGRTIIANNYGGAHAQIASLDIDIDSRDSAVDGLVLRTYPEDDGSGLGYDILVRAGLLRGKLALQFDVPSWDGWAGGDATHAGAANALVETVELQSRDNGSYGRLHGGGIHVDLVRDGFSQPNDQLQEHGFRWPSFRGVSMAPFRAARGVVSRPGTIRSLCKAHAERAGSRGVVSAIKSDGISIEAFDELLYDNAQGLGWGPQNALATTIEPLGRGYAHGLRFRLDDGAPGAAGTFTAATPSMDALGMHACIVDAPRCQLVGQKEDVVTTGTIRVGVFGCTVHAPSSTSWLLCGTGGGSTRQRPLAIKQRNCVAIGDPSSSTCVSHRIETKDSIDSDRNVVECHATNWSQLDGSPQTLATVQAGGVDLNSSRGDPEFADADAGDFSFSPGSILYEAGAFVPGRDFFGVARSSPVDIGAVEVSGGSGTPLSAPTTLAGAQVARTAVVTLTYDAAPEGATGIEARTRYSGGTFGAWTALGTPDGSSDVTAATLQTATLEGEARFTGATDPSPATSFSVAMLEPAPSTPSAPTLSQVGGTTLARVTISPVARADDGYLIEVSTTGSFAGEETVAGTIPDGSTYLDHDVGSYGSERWFRATAQNDVLGDSSASSSASITLAAPALDAPSDLSVEASGLVASLAWTDNAEGSSGFDIYRRPAGGSWSQVGTEPTDAGAESATSSVPSGGDWQFAVALADDEDEGNWSVSDVVAFVDPPPPPAGVAIEGTAVGGRAILATWTAPETEVPISYVLVEWTGVLDGSPIAGGAWQHGAFAVFDCGAVLFLVPAGATSIVFRVIFFRVDGSGRLVAGEPTESEIAYGSPEPEVGP